MNGRRDFYLKQLVGSMWDGQVKVVKGVCPERLPNG